MSNSLPPAIARQVAEADRLMNEQSAQPADPETPPAEPPSEPPQPAPTPAPVPSDDPNSPTWEQRFRSLQGIAAQQGERLREMEAQRRRVEELERLVQELKKAPEKPAEKPAADPKDVETFGADLVEMVQRYAERMFQSMSAQLNAKTAEWDARLVALEQQVTGVSKKTALTQEQQFYATLDVLVPSWKQVNESRRWLEWLGEIDPVYRAPRQSALDLAYSDFNAQAVAAIFNTFLSQHPPAQKPSLAAHVAPPTAAAPAPAVRPAPGRVFTNKEIENFFNDKARGRYVGREKEAQQLEAEINSAVAEGRIV